MFVWKLVIRDQRQKASCEGVQFSREVHDSDKKEVIGKATRTRPVVKPQLQFFYSLHSVPMMLLAHRQSQALKPSSSHAGV